MKDDKQKSRIVSRRRFLPILGGTLMIPFLGHSKQEEKSVVGTDSSENFETLLKPDGTTVKVRVGAIKKAKVVKKNISNHSLLSWLGKKNNPL